MYDSRPETYEHIGEVRSLVSGVVSDLLARANAHDQSKLVEPELSVFDEFTPKLRASTYGSAEYDGFRVAMAPALEHHYANNSHHPEHHANGIRDMSLMDITEMICDWIAACHRHDDGDIHKSIEINQKRFGYSDDLKAILHNTAKVLGE